MFYFIGALFLYGITISFSFLFSNMFIKHITLEEIQKEDEEELKMIEYQDQLNFEYKYMEEIEQMQLNLNLDTTELKETKMDFPFLNTTVIMFWENDTFFYYSTTDLIYKYLNVVCRKFIIENNAKQLYLDGSYNEINSPSVSSSLFITKQETNSLEKKINKFIRMGSIIDYENVLKHKNKNRNRNSDSDSNINEINILDFLSKRFKIS
jgi:hypothetical protein